MSSKVKKGIAIAMMMSGIAVCAVPFLLEEGNQKRTNGYIREFEEDEHEATKADQKKNAKNEKAGVIGIVEIPSLELKYPIFEGATSVELAEGIGHLSETTELCGKGNCVLAGHNGSSRGTYFTHLDEIELGDKVLVTNKEKDTHEYQVKEYRVVQPYDRWVTQASTDEQLTLFTCSDHGTKRFVVKCDSVKEYFGSDSYEADEDEI